MSPGKHYVVVREDLPLGLLCAEVCHAAGESAVFYAPPPGCHAVVLAASHVELMRLDRLLREKGFRVAAIYEDELGEPPLDDVLVALGIAPCSEGVQRWLRHLPLVGKERNKGK